MVNGKQVIRVDPEGDDLDTVSADLAEAQAEIAQSSLGAGASTGTEEPAPQAGVEKPPKRTCILIPYYDRNAPDVKDGLRIIRARVNAKRDIVEVRYFNAFDPLGAYSILCQELYSTETWKQGYYFDRVVIYAHGATEWRRTTEGDLIYKGPMVQPNDVSASTVLNAVGPHLNEDGVLYIAACYQWTISWQLVACEEEPHIDVEVLPGGGGCLYYRTQVYPYLTQGWEDPLRPNEKRFWEWLIDLVDF